MDIIILGETRQPAGPVKPCENVMLPTVHAGTPCRDVVIMQHVQRLDPGTIRTSGKRMTRDEFERYTREFLPEWNSR